MQQINHKLYDSQRQFDAWEAACLIVGVEPTSIDRENWLCVPGEVKAIFRLLEDAYHTAVDLCRNESLGTQAYSTDGSPIEFDVSANPPVLPSVELRGAYAHAVEEGYGLDTHTEAKLNEPHPKFWREDIEKWLALIEWKDARYFTKWVQEQEKPLGTRERETLLKLVIGMAIKGFDYDPDSKKNSAIPQIVASLEGVGLPLSGETVRKYLKEGKGLLPGNSSKD